MSHVAEISLEIRDLDALAAAAKELDLELIRDQKTYKWYGRSMGDYPLPVGFKKEDLGTCDHAIRIPGNDRAYEIGVCKRRDGKAGYVLQWDFFSGGYGMAEKVGGDKAQALVQGYATQVAIKTARAQGFRVIGQTRDAKGTVHVQVQR